MAAEVKKEIQLEIAHVLLTDIVGYSNLPIDPHSKNSARKNPSELAQLLRRVKATQRL